MKSDQDLALPGCVFTPETPPQDIWRGLVELMCKKSKSNVVEKSGNFERSEQFTVSSNRGQQNISGIPRDQALCWAILGTPQNHPGDLIDFFLSSQKRTQSHIWSFLPSLRCREKCDLTPYSCSSHRDSSENAP